MTDAEVFPPLLPEDILAFQFSNWYPKFSHVSVKSTIIRPLSEDFVRYLNTDGIQIPVGSENSPSTQIDSEPEDEDDSDGVGEVFAFPELDTQIREAVERYGGVFPKLNFSSPKDATWVLPVSSPLKCTSPMDVYILLKSSDFIAHDLSHERVFEGCSTSEQPQPRYELELVLRKWYSFDPSREFRCFVRNRALIGISQRDTVQYDYLKDAETRQSVQVSLLGLWEREIKHKWPTAEYTFDVLLTRNLASGHVVDFNPYAPRTDALLFDYDELHEIATRQTLIPVLRVVDSPVTRNMPANYHNMVPSDLLTLGEGQTIDDFARKWHDEVQKASAED